MPEITKGLVAALASEIVHSLDGPQWDGSVTPDGMNISPARIAFAILLGQPAPTPCTQAEWENVQERHLFHDWEPTAEEKRLVEDMAYTESPA